MKAKLFAVLLLFAVLAGLCTFVYFRPATDEQADQPGKARVVEPVAVTPQERQDFLELVSKLPTGREFIAVEGIETASPHTRVFLAITESDLTEYAAQKGFEKYDLYELVALIAGLAERKEQRRFAVEHFADIQHPELKLFWAAILFGKDPPSDEIVRYLRESLASEKGAAMLSSMIGPKFKEFQNRVQDTATNAKE